MSDSQIGTEVPLIIESERRDTFLSIALAASFLNLVQKVNEDTVLVVLPVDPYEEDSFFEKVERA
jgi:mannose-1-phosphate guanylyltransferase